jgi:DNA end-binding protein Ku
VSDNNASGKLEGHTKFADFKCEIALCSALTSADKISFNIINRKTENRVECGYGHV